MPCGMIWRLMNTFERISHKPENIGPAKLIVIVE